MSKTKQTEFILKLESPINFKYVNAKRSSCLEEVSNHDERKEFVKKDCEMGYQNPDSPAEKCISERPTLNCTYVENILFNLKNDLMKIISKEYSHILFGSGYSVYFLGNFKQPLLLDDICDMAKITIMREIDENYKITVFLDVVLYKE